MARVERNYLHEVRADLAEKAKRMPGYGTCRHCGCTAANPCRQSSGDTCNWMTVRCNACSSPACVTAEIRRHRNEAAAAVRKAVA